MNSTPHSIDILALSRKLELQAREYKTESEWMRDLIFGILGLGYLLLLIVIGLFFILFICAWMADHICPGAALLVFLFFFAALSWKAICNLPGCRTTDR